MAYILFGWQKVRSSKHELCVKSSAFKEGLMNEHIKPLGAALLRSMWKGIIKYNAILCSNPCSANEFCLRHKLETGFTWLIREQFCHGREQRAERSMETLMLDPLLHNPTCTFLCTSSSSTIFFFRWGNQNCIQNLRSGRARDVTIYSILFSISLLTVSNTPFVLYTVTVL